MTDFLDDIWSAGGTWKPLNPPRRDSQGNPYECDHAVRFPCRLRGLRSLTWTRRVVRYISMATPSAMMLAPRTARRPFLDF